MSDAPLAFYTAYPIDQSVLNQEFVQLVMRGQRMLLDTGLFSTMYDPGDAFTVREGGGLHRIISRVNELALEEAEVVLAFLPAGVPSIGVPIEVDRAIMGGKWVVLASDAQSFSLAGYDSPRVIRCQMTEDGLRQAVGRIAEAIRVAPPVIRERPDGPAPLPTLVGPGGRLPSRGYDDDAGLDLHVVGNHTITGGGFLDIPCAVSIELPAWAWGLITGRSSTLRNRKLLVHSGIIDPGWRGDLYAGTMNVGVHSVDVKDGERIAQLIILPNVTREFQPVKVDSLSEHPRGISGFGSTGL